MLLETNVEGAWVSKQTALRTPATTAVKRLRKVGGDINLNSQHGAENYSDGSRFQDSADFVNQLTGTGNPTAQAQVGMLGYIFYLMLGQEVVTGAGDPYQHVITPGPASFPSTWWKMVGQNTVLRQVFNDCYITSVRLEGSFQTKIVKITPTFTSLDPGYPYATDPVKTVDADEPLNYVMAEGTWEIDGAVYRGHSSFAFTVSDGLTPQFGDSVMPYDVSRGQGAINLESITLFVDANGLEFYNQQVYGTSAPAAGTPPLHQVPALGSYSFTLTQAGPTPGPERSCMVEFPHVRWNPGLAIAGNPDGSAAHLALAGQVRHPVQSDPHIRVTVNSADPAYT